MIRKVSEKSEKKSKAKKAPAAAAKTTKPFALPETDKKRFLHVGAGVKDERRIPPQFRNDQWLEIRLSPNPQTKPDIQAAINDLSALPDESMDAIWLPHILPRLYIPQIMHFMTQCKRVLKTDGTLLMTLFNLNAVARLIVEDKLDDSPQRCLMGNLTALEMLYGPVTNLSPQDILASSFHSGVTMRGAGKILLKNGFHRVQVRFEDYDVWVLGYKPAAGADLSKETITMLDGKRLRREQEGQDKAATNQTDELDRGPMIWKPLGLKAG